MLKYYLWAHTSVHRTHPCGIKTKVKQIPPDEKNKQTQKIRDK